MRSKFQFFTLSLLCAMWLCFASEKVLAAEDPVQMLQNVTSHVMGALKENREQLRQHPDRLYDVVNRYILPHVDFTEMARWVVGRNAWQNADAGTKQAFVEEFKTLVVRSYAQSLLNYTNQTIDFSPLRGGQASKGRVQVSSVIRQPGKKSIRMDYRLLQEGGTWKVYDIIIEGVSLVQGYRSQFAEDVAQGGLANVVEKIRQHNSAGRRR